MSKFRSRMLSALSLSAGTLSLISTLATAQTAASAKPAAFPADDETQQLEKFVVTGSYIPFSADAPAIPVSIIGAPQIEATGEQSDLLEVIRRAVPQFIGNGNLGASNSNVGENSTNGGSQLQLRGVKTLVLINGRRAAFAPVSATGGFEFVDVNAIPVAAVERIEVLKDGASALYGSDAVSGVVNIILKKDYQGVSIGTTYRVATDQGHWSERSARAVAGAKSGNTSVTVSLEWSKTDPLFENERRWSADQTGKTTNFPGVVTYLGDGKNYLLAPGKTPPLNTDLSAADLVAAGIYTGPYSDVQQFFNLSPYVTLSLGNERTGATAELTQRLSEKAELFGEILYSHTSTFEQLAAQGILGMPYFANNVTPVGGTGYTNPDHPENPFDYYTLVHSRFVDHPRIHTNKDDSFHGIVGARGEFADDFTWEIAANINKIWQYHQTINVIDRVNLANAIDAGTINLFQRQPDPAALAAAQILGTAYSHNVSGLNSFDARTTGQIFATLPAGAIGYATGVEYRKETLSARPDPGSYAITDVTNPLLGFAARWDGSNSTNPFSVSRDVKSAFAELRIPITSPKQSIRGANTLELSAAVRTDRYSDSGNPVVPKFTLRWLPLNDEFALRTSYSQSFSAEPLFALFGPGAVGFGEQPIGLKFIDGRITPSSVDQPFRGSVANPDLKPERSHNYNVGFVYSPRAIKGLSVEVDYFYIKQTDIAGTVNDTFILQDVETLGTASQYAKWVTIDGFNGTPITAPGQISKAFDAAGGSFSRVYFKKMAQNFVSGMQDGIDFNIGYSFTYNPIGKIDLTLNGLVNNRYSVENIDYVGTTNGGSSLNGGTLPRWLADFRAEVTHGSWYAGGAVYFIPAVSDTSAAPDVLDNTSDAHVESYIQFDGYFGYRFHGTKLASRYLDGLSVRLGCNDIFNQEPPQARASWQDANADSATYGPWGRVVYVSADYKF